MSPLLQTLRVAGLSTVYTGLLAVLKHGGQAADGLEGVDRDFSDDIAQSVLGAIASLCTPHRGAINLELRDHIHNMVRGYVADGRSPVVKCGAILQSHFQNVVLVVRDRGHAAYRSCQILVTHADVFCAYGVMFSMRHTR